MGGPATRTAADVLAEDHLLWEFWLNHGLDAAALRRRLAELPEEASAAYIASNALYGCFEEKLARLVEEQGALARCRAPLRQAIDLVRSGRAIAAGPGNAEGRLLAILSAGAAAAAEEGAAARAEAARVASWPAFVRAACRANLVPAVAAAAGPCGVAEAIPPAEREFLERAAEGIRARNRRLLGILESILRAFEAAGLSPVLLKETALLREVYPGDGDRMIGDLDVLFAAGELDEVERILIGMGYTPFERIWSRAWYRAHHHHLAPPASEAEAVKIEPHSGIWIPSGPSAPIIPEMIAASRPHRSFRARRPAAAHALFHMLVDLHGNASIGKLGQAADIAALLRAEGREAAAGEVAELARRTGATPYVEDSLALVAAVYGRGLLVSAGGGLESLLPAGPPPIERRILRRLALRHFYGFEPRASALSLPGTRLLHKALIRPGGRISRAAYLLRSVAGSPGAGEGMGDIARRGMGTRAARLGRAATFPFRLAARALGLRRG